MTDEQKIRVKVAVVQELNRLKRFKSPGRPESYSDVIRRLVAFWDENQGGEI